MDRVLDWLDHEHIARTNYQYSILTLNSKPDFVQFHATSVAAYSTFSAEFAGWRRQFWGWGDPAASNSRPGWT